MRLSLFCTDPSRRIACIAACAPAANRSVARSALQGLSADPEEAQGDLLKCTCCKRGLPLSMSCKEAGAVLLSTIRRHVRGATGLAASTADWIASLALHSRLSTTCASSSSLPHTSKPAPTSSSSRSSLIATLDEGQAYICGDQLQCWVGSLRKLLHGSVRCYIICTAAVAGRRQEPKYSTAAKPPVHTCDKCNAGITEGEAGE